MSSWIYELLLLDVLNAWELVGNQQAMDCQAIVICLPVKESFVIDLSIVIPGQWKSDAIVFTTTGSPVWSPILFRQTKEWLQASEPAYNV